MLSSANCFLPSSVYHRPLRLCGTTAAAAPGLAVGSLCVCAVPSPLAGLVARLSGAVPRQCTWREVFCCGHRWHTKRGFGRLPQASSQEVPDRPGSGPSPWSSTRAAPWLASVASPQLRGWGGGYCGGRQCGSEH